MQNAPDALEFLVAHAGGEAADQTAVAGIAVLVVPLHFLGLVVLLAPYLTVLLGKGLLLLALAGCHLHHTTIGEEADGERLCTALGVCAVVERVDQVARDDVAAPLQCLDELVYEPFAVLRQFLAHPQVNIFVADALQRHVWSLLSKVCSHHFLS